MQGKISGAAKKYLLIHLILLLLLGGLLLYNAVIQRMGGIVMICPLRDLFHFYCPLCGGTRAVLALLRFRLVDAFSCNPFVCLAGILLAFFDLRAGIRLLKGQENPLSLPRFLFPALLAAGIIYAIIRNVLLIAGGIDPLGDLLLFYSAPSVSA